MYVRNGISAICDTSTESVAATGFVPNGPFALIRPVRLTRAATSTVAFASGALLASVAVTFTPSKRSSIGDGA